MMLLMTMVMVMMMMMMMVVTMVISDADQNSHKELNVDDNYKDWGNSQLLDSCMTKVLLI